ncbi:hypothetical protein [Dyadobacter sp. LHD-138]|uniref:hypothetical protein n=1 Tax=Dyadobacter sp. LHD-138 TaxID=3071413 RepID=UPI0027E1F6B6|nr:hypothetical protein [Dyadobacter sp. LHD-138]MDQ6481558.1 hypothetical protein [Dyadobacter sp. LHD-138]
MAIIRIDNLVVFSFKYALSLIKKLIIRLLKRREMESQILSTIFQKEYNLKIGQYSYGYFDTARISNGTTIGRYCSFGPGVRMFNGNHGIEWASTHPFLYNPSLNMVAKRKLRELKLRLKMMFGLEQTQ